VTPRTLAPLLDELASQQPPDALGELRQQNSELLATLNELGTRQDDLVRLNRELEDNNRGVVALYAELDEKAGHLRRADETKSRFLSHMSHEFRTPLNSIVALSRLLLDRVDVKQFFAGEPHEFVAAGDGVAGLAAARARHPELIFLDIMMPRMDGFEMLKQLRSDPETRAIPVIVFSARALSNRERRQLEALGAAILSKDRLAAGDVNPSLREILAGIGLSGLLSTALSAARQSRQS
jgi:CheY-like chemotaxis protein